MRDYDLDKEILQAIIKAKHLSPITALAHITLGLLEEVELLQRHSPLSAEEIDKLRKEN